MSILIRRKLVVYGKLSSIFMVLSKFWRQILYIAFNRDTFVFLNENLGHLTLIFVKTTPKLPFGRWCFPTIFRNFWHICWTILNDFDVRQTRKNVSMLTYYDHIKPIRVTLSIQNLKIRSLSQLGYVLTSTWDKSRMRLSQLYKVFQDTNTTDELMLFIPAISWTISRAPSSNVHFTTEFIFLPIAPRGFSERDHRKISFILL